LAIFAAFNDRKSFSNHESFFAILISFEMKNRLRYTLLPLLLFVIMFVEVRWIAAQGRPVSMEEAVKLSLEQNRDLRVARLDLDKNEQVVREAWSGVLPNLSFSAQYNRNINPPVSFLPFTVVPIDANRVALGFGPLTPFAFGLKNSLTGTLSFSQPLFQGSAFAGVSAARIVDKLSKEIYVGNVAATVTEVKKSYYDVLIAQETVKLVQQTISRSELAQNDTRLLYRQGLAADLDTLRAFVNVENFRPTLITSQNRLEISKTVLKTKIGIPSTEEIVLTDSLNYDGQPPTLLFDQAYTEAIANRPEVKQAQFTVESDEAKIFSEFSGHLPSLSLVGQMQKLTQFDDGQSITFAPLVFSVGLQLNVPIFSGFKTSAKVQQAEIAKVQHQTQLDNTKELIRADVKTSLSSVEEAQRRILVQVVTVQSAERSYTLTRARRAQGLSTQLDINDAELALTQAKGNYLQAVYDYLVAKANLDKSLGRTGNQYASFKK
jgi:outer membrane protein